VQRFILRPDLGLSRRLFGIRKSHDRLRENVAASHVAQRRASCQTCPSGRARKLPPTAKACTRLLGQQPDPGAVVPKGRGNWYKNEVRLKAGRTSMAAHGKDLDAAARAQRAKEGGRTHGTGGQERRAAAAAEKAQQPKPLPQPRGGGKRKAAAGATAKAAETAAAEAADESDSDGLMGRMSDGEVWVDTAELQAELELLQKKEERRKRRRTTEPEAAPADARAGSSAAPRPQAGPSTSAAPPPPGEAEARLFYRLKELAGPPPWTQSQLSAIAGASGLWASLREARAARMGAGGA
jgi:hypothetical protein